MAQKKFYEKTPFIIGASAVTLGTGIFAYFKISKKIKEKQANNAGNQVDNTKDPKRALATTYAQRAYSAFFPSGHPTWWDGTDEDALFKIATEMYRNKVSFSYVSEAYKKLYNRTFVTDLTDELDSTDLAKFYNKNKGLGGIIRNPIEMLKLKRKERTRNLKTISSTQYL